MFRYRYIILFVFCMILFPNVSKAECSYERQAELSRIASNVQFSYSYEMDDIGRPNFIVDILNIRNDIYIQDGYGNVIYNDISTEYGSSQSIEYTIYSNDDSCKDSKILNSYITLPNYNYYSQSTACSKYPNFKYCKIWMNTGSITSEMFDSELNDFINKSNNNDNIVRDVSTFSTLFDVLEKNKLMFIISIIAVCLLIIIGIIRAAKKR